MQRRLPDFEGRSSIPTWLHAIALRVARRYRTARVHEPLDEIAEPASTASTDPGFAAERADALRLLDELLDALDGPKREVLVLAEIEQLSAPEIAEITGVNVNTVYARLRAARSRLEQAAARARARGRWSGP